MDSWNQPVIPGTLSLSDGAPLPDRRITRTWFPTSTQLVGLAGQKPAMLALKGWLPTILSEPLIKLPT